MAEVQFPEVKDRNVATPSRVRITKAVGIEDDNVFDVEAVPGTVYEEGTPLNKEFFDKLKLYMDNNVGSPDNPVPITNGGTGANTAEGARTNLGVYSTTEVDEIVERAGAKIDPHINSKITDAPEGVHGIYIDDERRIWTDPDGDGSFTDEVHAVDNYTITYANKEPKLTAHLGAILNVAQKQALTCKITKQTCTLTGMPTSSARTLSGNIRNCVTMIDDTVYLVYPAACGIVTDTNYYNYKIGLAKITKEGVITTKIIDLECKHNKPDNLGSNDGSDISLTTTSNGNLILALGAGSYYQNVAAFMLIIDPNTMSILYRQYPVNSAGNYNVNWSDSSYNKFTPFVHGVNLSAYGTTWMCSSWNYRTDRKYSSDGFILFKLTEAGVSSYSFASPGYDNKTPVFANLSSKQWIRNFNDSSGYAIRGTNAAKYNSLNIYTTGSTTTIDSASVSSVEGLIHNLDASYTVAEGEITKQRTRFDYDSFSKKTETENLASLTDVIDISNQGSEFNFTTNSPYGYCINSSDDWTIGDGSIEHLIRTPTITMSEDSNVLVYMNNSDANASDYSTLNVKFTIKLNDTTFITIPNQSNHRTLTVNRVVYE